MAVPVALVLRAEAAGANPLLPNAYEWLVVLPLALVIDLPIAAVISLAADRHCTAPQRLLWLLWLLLVVFAPFLGPLSPSRSSTSVDWVRRPSCETRSQ